jgi:hypothetical protein
MHPIERLRYVARASGADPSLLVRETAVALADVARVEPVGLVPACRRLIQRHVTTGPIWWLAARVLTAADPVEEAWRAVGEVDDDPTERLLAASLPDDATVVVVGWPDIGSRALHRRGDLEVLVIDASGEGAALARALEAAGVQTAAVPEAGAAAAAVVCDLVVVEAEAGGPTGIIAPMGSHAAAAVATSAEVPVMAVAGVGRMLPGDLWDAMLRRFDDEGGEPWDRPVELVPADLLTSVLGPDGPQSVEAGLAQATCPVAPELLRPAG